MRALLFSSVLALCGCVGPEAPDDEVCRDVVQRLCAQPYCASASTKLQLPDMDCERALLERTGCGSSTFAFTMPTRDRVLECRLPLVRESTNRQSKPSCDFVDETFRNCPDLVTFLGGTP